MGYLEYQSVTKGRIEVRNIEIIESAVKQIKAANDITLDKVSFISSFQSNLDNDVLVKQINDEVALADDYLYREDRLWNKDNDLAILNGESEGKSSIVIGLMKVYYWYNPKGAEYSLLEQKYGEYLLNIFDSEGAVNWFIYEWSVTIEVASQRLNSNN